MMAMTGMGRRWASVKLTLVMLWFGILPFDLDAPVMIALALLGLAVVIGAPILLHCVRSVISSVAPPVPVLSVRTTAPDARPLPRPEAPGTPGTVRSRAPARLFAFHGGVALL